MHQLKSILLLACLLCYTSAQAIWLSPDPLLDKYPYISPYAYCNWNPIENIDPDDSKGCLLSSSRTIDFVGNSKITLPKITNYVASKNWLVKLNIFNAFK